MKIIKFFEIINFDTPIVLEDTFGDLNLKGAGRVKIMVFSNEGNYIPHFHIKSTGGGDIDGCLKLFAEEGFVHGHHKTKFTSKQLRQINNYLKTETITESGKKSTIWKDMAAYWITSNSDNNYNISNQPNYNNVVY